jgi:hypothetical protein
MVVFFTKKTPVRYSLIEAAESQEVKQGSYATTCAGTDRSVKRVGTRKDIETCKKEKGLREHSE